MRILLAALMLAASISTSQAACPVGTKYQCYPTMNGKMQCGCY